AAASPGCLYVTVPGAELWPATPGEVAGSNPSELVRVEASGHRAVVQKVAPWHHSLDGAPEDGRNLGCK
ncbi:MAG TPA: hypothetical protein VIQ02_00400, partial [Jiangellaceae bacterium]